jgi:hypothetical protein
VLLLTSFNNANLLRALEIFVVAIVWLFFFRVIRAVWVEVRPPRASGFDPAAGGGSAIQGGMAAPGASSPPEPKRDRSAQLRLRVVEPPQNAGRIYEIGNEVTVGRAAGCGVQVDDSYTSGIHARLFRRDGALWVEDLGSTNGTWCNAERVATPTKLVKGDIVQVGGTVFEVVR